MIHNNKVQPLPERFETIGSVSSSATNVRGRRNSGNSSTREVNDWDSISTVGLEESSYLKLRPFSRLDPMLVRLLTFLNCFGLFVNFDMESDEQKTKQSKNGKERSSRSWCCCCFSFSFSKFSMYLKICLMLFIDYLIQEVVYDVNLRQSKLLAEQKRSTPLLTFVIVAYSWFTLVIPVISDLCLVMIGSHLFRFYSRTTATVCNGMFFGKRTSVDSWFYYLSLVLIALLDAIGQVVVLGVWPQSIDNYLKMLRAQEGLTAWVSEPALTPQQPNTTITSISSTTPAHLLVSDERNVSAQLMAQTLPVAPTGMAAAAAGAAIEQPRIRAYLLDSILGEEYAHGDLGVCIKTIFLMIQFIHSYAFFMIVILLAHHYATVINNINDNLEKHEFRKLLRQLIILRDSSEQISLMISLPLCIVIILVFIRQIALNGVFIQSTMLAYENLAVSLQSFTSGMSIFMTFFYCDGLQSASKQAHRLKTEQTVVNENQGGNQSIYEFLDYLDRLSKSIRITFFNIITINKSSLVGLYGHILTLTFVTS